jgi:ABC-2 type transport system permease protein
MLSAGATFGFMLACLGVIWWVFKTGTRLKQ